MRPSPTPLKPFPALAIGTALVAVLLGTLLPFGQELSLAVPALLLVVPVVLAGLLGGRLVALAVTAEAAFAYVFFLPPFGSPAIELGHDLGALALFVIVASAISALIANVLGNERRRSAAERDRLAALERVDVERRALLRSVSHDLRTPLATIRAATSELSGAVDFDPVTRAELLDLVADEAERLDRIVANLLSLSRVEAGALLPDRQPVDLAELVTECTRRLARMMKRVHTELDLPDDLPLVEVDYSQMDQVLTNLLENASRHTPAGRTVRVAVRAAGETLVLTVDDDGDGVPEALREQIFEPFATATGATSSGIGLAICRAILDAHGGTIAVGDSPSGGARLLVILPIAGRSGVPVPVPEEPAHHG